MTIKTQQGREIISTDEEIAHFARFAKDVVAELQMQLNNEKKSPGEIETFLNQSFQQGADNVFAAFIAEISKSQDADLLCQQSRKNAAEHGNPLKAPRLKNTTLTLLGGLSIIVESFFLPSDSAARKKRNGEQSKGSGIYPELAQFGFGKGASPALTSLVARQSAVCSSFEQASAELERRGVKYSPKQVRALTNQVGHGLLSLRKEQVEKWKAGDLPPGNQLAGKTVIVSADGGRTRHRISQAKAENAPPKTWPKYTAEWKEPKLLTIYVVDEKGRKERDQSFWIDGSYQGPDHMAEIIAYQLHILGAAKAAHVGFTADGAEWFWNRLGWIKKSVGLEEEKTSLILDFWHAAGYLSSALKSLEWEDGTQRQKKYRELRRELNKGKWKAVVKELRKLARANHVDTAHEIWGPVKYLEFHGKEGLLEYAKAKKKGLPLGSGAIESTIRRTVNQRMKGNGIFWGEMGSEVLLHIRSLVLSENWDERMEELQSRWKKTRVVDTEWEATNMLEKLDTATLRERKLAHDVHNEGIASI